MRIGGALDLTQLSTDPSAPPTGRQVLYFKNDGQLYFNQTDGTVLQIVAGPTGTLDAGGVTTTPPDTVYDAGLP